MFNIFNALLPLPKNDEPPFNTWSTRLDNILLTKGNPIFWGTIAGIMNLVATRKMPNPMHRLKSTGTISGKVAAGALASSVLISGFELRGVKAYKDLNGGLSDKIRDCCFASNQETNNKLIAVADSVHNIQAVGLDPTEARVNLNDRERQYLGLDKPKNIFMPQYISTLCNQPDANHFTCATMMQAYGLVDNNEILKKARPC